MKILKYKKTKNNKYVLTLENNKELELYEEVILNKELLLKKEIKNNDLINIIEENNYWLCYYTALKYIKVRSRSIKEVQDKLISKDFKIEDVSKVINKLCIQGYLNDKVYANSFLNEQLITTFRGPGKIKIALKQKGINVEIINEVMNLYDDDVQYDKLKKIITKMIKANRNKSNSFLKRKIMMNLVSEGFSKSIIDKVINEQEFTSDSDIKEKELAKITKKLATKYKGTELEYKIKEQMIRKGFYS